MLLRISRILIVSVATLLTATGMEVNASSLCKNKLIESTQTTQTHFKDLVLNIIAKEYLQKRADLASESPKEQEQIVQDLKLRAGLFFDEIVKTSPEDLNGIESSLAAQKLIQKMKFDELHFLEEKRLIQFYDNLVGYLTNAFHWRIKSAQARRFLNGTQFNAEKEFVIEVVNENIIKIFLNAAFDRSRNDVTSEKAKFFFLALVLKGKVKDAIRKHLASNRTPEKPQFPIDDGFDLRARLEAIKLDPELALKVQMAIERLRPDERELIHLIYYRALTLVEAANHLEKKLGTLKSTLSRTLAKLRLILDPQDF